MSNELALNDPMALINRGVENPEELNTEGLSSSLTFLPDFALAYAISKTVTVKGIARPGEFTLGGQTSLGKKVEVVPLDFRRHLGYQKDDYSYEAEMFHFSDMGDVRDNEEYTQFRDNCPKNLELVEGVDLLLWLPEQRVFCKMFLKKTTVKYAKQIVDDGIGGRVLEISTEVQSKGSKTWYNINVVKTQKALLGSKLQAVDACVELPIDKFQEAIGIWRSPMVAKRNTENTEDVAR